MRELGSPLDVSGRGGQQKFLKNEDPNEIRERRRGGGVSWNSKKPAFV
jgi:hypothetical protein